MNSSYLNIILILGALVGVGAACCWARMKPCCVVCHLIVALVAVPVLAFTAYLGAAAPLALLSIGLDSVLAINVDAALETIARVVSGFVVAGIFIGYFRSERSWVEARRSDRVVQVRDGSRPLSPLVMGNGREKPREAPVHRGRERKSIGEEYFEIRSRCFAPNRSGVGLRTGEF